MISDYRLQQLITVQNFRVNFREPTKSKELRMMVENNIRQENKKRDGRVKRIPEQISMHTQRGLGAEYAIQSLDGWDEVSPIVEDAMKLNYMDRQRDLVVDGSFVQVKSKDAKTKWWGFGHGQAESLSRAMNHNEYILVVDATMIENLIWEYTPRFLVDTRFASKYIRNSDYSKSYYFHHEMAVNRGHAVDLRSMINVAA